MNPYWLWRGVFKPDPLQSLYPDVPTLPHKDWSYVANQWLDEVAAGVEKGIRDTHAWKETVRREGLREARRRLRLSLLAGQLPCVNPRN